MAKKSCSDLASKINLETEGFNKRMRQAFDAFEKKAEAKKEPTLKELAKIWAAPVSGDDSLSRLRGSLQKIGSLNDAVSNLSGYLNNESALLRNSMSSEYSKLKAFFSENYSNYKTGLAKRYSQYKDKLTTSYVDVKSSMIKEYSNLRSALNKFSARRCSDL